MNNEYPARLSNTITPVDELLPVYDTNTQELIGEQSHAADADKPRR